MPQPGEAYDASLCSLCQSRRWAVRRDGERLCGPCAACCRSCGRPPSFRSPGLPDGLCRACRGLCERCGAPRPADGCRRCARPAGPRPDPVGFIIARLPDPLMRALPGTLPREFFRLVAEQSAHRSPVALAERAERRWYLYWCHWLDRLDPETRLPMWQPEEILLCLLAPASCADPRCEDGTLVDDGRACPSCSVPTYRFAPAPPEPARTAPAAERAAEVRRALRAARARRPGAVSGGPEPAPAPAPAARAG